jgi:hypothetical protein
VAAWRASSMRSGVDRRDMPRGYCASRDTYRVARALQPSAGPHRRTRLRPGSRVTTQGRGARDEGTGVLGSKWGLRTICFPSSDTTFATDVERALASETIKFRWQLEDALRGQYPEVRVTVREISGEPGITWYVYRDRLLPPQPDEVR